MKIKNLEKINNAYMRIDNFVVGTCVYTKEEPFSDTVCLITNNETFVDLKTGCHYSFDDVFIKNSTPVKRYKDLVAKKVNCEIVIK